MKDNEFTFYSDETPDITSLEQLALDYVTSATRIALHTTIIMNGEMKEHFIGLIPIRIVVGTQISAVKIMSAR